MPDDTVIANFNGTPLPEEPAPPPVEYAMGELPVPPRRVELPSNNQAEVSVLGSILLDNEVMDIVYIILKTKAFASPVHRHIYQAMIAMHKERQAIDLLTLRSRLEELKTFDAVGGVDYLTSLLESVPASANAEHYALLVAQAATRRDLYHVAEVIKNNALNKPVVDAVDKAQSAIFDLSVRANTRPVSDFKGVLNEVMEQVTRNLGRTGVLTGLPTGYADFDKMTCGLQNGELIILAARPSIGKTSLMLNFLDHLCIKNQHCAVIFTLEMSRQQIAQNLLCMRARVDSARLRAGTLAGDQAASLPAAMEGMENAKIFIDDTAGVTIGEILTKSRRLKSQHGLDLIVVDYLQLMGGITGDNREQSISALSRGLKALARELSVPVIALSQLNRKVEERVNHRPRMSDLRESGAIEQDADVVMLLHRPGFYEKNADDQTTELIIAKQRNGPVGVVWLTFIPGQFRFAPQTQNTYEDGF